MNILGIETTCDETSLALVADGNKIIEEMTVSQILKHQKYGGVVPDLGAREHLTNLTQIGAEFIEKVKDHNIDAVAVASKIGLPPAVQVGEAYAAGLAKSLNVPLIPVNHVLAHMWGVWVDPAFDEKPQFPLLGLIVSGGHTQLITFDSPTDYEIIGDTLDDAVGEAFDKVASMLKLPYPGGPQVEEQAKIGDNGAIAFPVPMKDDERLVFSFSGLKTAVRTYIDKERPNVAPGLEKFFVADVCASFQEVAFQSIANKVTQAMKETKLNTLVIGGGVAANQRLIDVLFREISEKGFQFDLFVPNLKYCTDNGSLIAGYAFNHV
jgi:N6-L-threonylcarbamoyladenine synthase